METTHAEAPKPKTNFLLIFARFRELGIIGFIVLLMIVVGLIAPSFLTLSNMRDILMDISILMIVALAQAMTIITRGIDLSVSSMIGLTAMMVAFTIRGFPYTPPAMLILLGLGLGVFLGSVNGTIIAFGKVPPIIATLGTLSIYRGLIFLYSNGSWINAYEMPTSFKQLAKAAPFGLPNLVIFAIVVGIIAYVFLNFSQAGRNIFALGSNPDAAKMAGIRTERVLFMVYAIAGLASGLAGVLWASRYEAAQTNTATGFELQTVAASVVGGVSLLGGVGTVPGILLGALLLGMIQNALTLVNISPFWQLAVQGLLILLAVISDASIQQRVKQTIRRGGVQ
jgi:rhamnose transport system permease protein